MVIGWPFLGTDWGKSVSARGVRDGSCAPAIAGRWQRLAPCLWPADPLESNGDEAEGAGLPDDPVGIVLSRDCATPMTFRRVARAERTARSPRCPPCKDRVPHPAGRMTSGAGRANQD